MSVIYFNSNQEIFSFCEFLFYENKNIDVHWKSSESWGNQLIVKNCSNELKHEEKIAEAMVGVFIKYRLMKMIEEVIRKKYHYSDLDEIERILDVMDGMLIGKYPHLAEDFTASKRLLCTIFEASLTESKITYYDSVIKFRINAFKEQLIQTVGLAIDEFKREEEHQTYIHTLREYMMNRIPIYPEIHLIQGEQFSFYKPNGMIFSKKELKKLMMKEPLYIVGLDNDEWNLAPLITMTPKKIYIYGEDPSDPKTLTVINIFQERVIFKSLREFPFSSSIKKT